MSSSEKCGTCFYRRESECHRFPPQIAPVKKAKATNDCPGWSEVKSDFFYPRTYASDWCGEYKPKETE